MAEHLEWFAAQHKQQNEAAKAYPETPEGRKIFDAACKGDDKELKRLLRKYGDRIKYLLEERVNGRTALMAACAKGLTKCARLLMETPTAVVAEDDKGRTPLDLAQQYGFSAVAAELREPTRRARVEESPRESVSKPAHAKLGAARTKLGGRNTSPHKP